MTTSSGSGGGSGSGATTNALLELSRVRDVVDMQLPGHALEDLRAEMDALKDASNPTMSQATADKWAALLEHMAVPLHNFSDIMDAVIHDRQQRLHGTSTLSGMLYFVLCVLVALVVMWCVQMVSKEKDGATIHTWFRIGMMTGLLVVLGMVFHVVLLYTKDDTQTLLEATGDNQPNMRFLLMIKTRLADRVLVRWVYERMAGVPTDTDGSNAVDGGDGEDELPDASYEVRRSNGCKADPLTLSSPCTDTPYNPCDVHSVLRTTQDVLLGRKVDGTVDKPYCPAVLAEVCRHLLTLRDELGNWDRVRLWRTVSSGVERVRGLLRPDAPRPPVTAGPALARAVDRMVPTLQLSVGEISNMVVNMDVIAPPFRAVDAARAAFQAAQKQAQDTAARLVAFRSRALNPYAADQDPAVIAATADKQAADRLQAAAAADLNLKLQLAAQSPFQRVGMQVRIGDAWAAAVGMPDVRAAVYDPANDGAWYAVRDLAAATTTPGALTYSPVAASTQDPATAARLLLRRPADASQTVMVCGVGVDLGNYKAVALTDDQVNQTMSKGAFAVCSAVNCDAYSGRDMYRLQPNTAATPGIGQVFATAPSADTTTTTCVRMPVQTLYSLANTYAAMESMRSALAASLLPTVMDLSVDPAAPEVQRRVHAALETYYGTAQYNGSNQDSGGVITSGVRTAVQDVLNDTAKLAARARRRQVANAGHFAGAPTVLSRLRQLPAPDLAVLQVQMTSLQVAAGAHMSNFPPRTDVAAGRVVRAVALYLCAAIIICYALFAIQRVQQEDLALGTLAQQVCVAATIIVLAVTLFDSVIQRRSRSRTHNAEVMRRNGAVLVTASQRLKDGVDALVAPPPPTGTGGGAAMLTGLFAAQALDHAQHVVTQGAALIQAFDHCNPVTAAQPAPPFPVDEVAIRAAVLAALAALVLYVAQQMKPGFVMARLKEYLDVKRALHRGDMVPPLEIQRLLGPVQPGTSTSWSAMGWAANAAAIFVVIWLILNQRSDISAYEASLQVDPGCV